MRSRAVAIVGTTLGMLLVPPAMLAQRATSQRKEAQPSASQREVFLTLRDANTIDADGTTPLHRAVLTGDLGSVEQFIKTGASVTSANRYGVMPLALAAAKGNAEVVGALLKAGADPNTTSGEGETVLMTASRAGHAAAVQQLLDAGANPNARERWLGQTALMWAAAEGHAAVVQALVAKGADPTMSGNIHEQHAYKPNTIGNTPVTMPKGGMTALHYAARAGALDTVKALASIPGIDLNQVDPDGLTALHYAAFNVNYDVAAYLLDIGADPNRADGYGRTVLHIAVDQDKPEYEQVAVPEPTGSVQARDLMKLALAKGANLEAPINATVPPRCWFGCRSGMTLGSTPIRRAAQTSNAEVVQLLLAAGADATVPSQDGTNALMAAAGVTWNKDRGIATEDESIQTIELLLAAGLDINAANNRGETALHGAAVRGADEVVTFLVAKGANLTAKDRVGRTPLDVAMGVGTGEVSNVSYEVPEVHPSTAKVLRELMTAKGLMTQR